MPIFKIIAVGDQREEKLETTRWVVKTRVKDTTWSKLIKRLQLLFDTKSTKFFISWYDGTDYCSIHDWKDLQGAVEFFAQYNESPDKAVRLYVSITKRDLPTIFADGSPQEEDLASEVQFSTVDDSELDTTVDQESIMSGGLYPVDVIAQRIAETDIASDEELAEEDSKQPVEQENDQKRVSQSTVEQAIPQFAYSSQPMGPPMAPFSYYGMGPVPQMYPMMMPQWMPNKNSDQSLPTEMISGPSIRTSVSPPETEVKQHDEIQTSGTTETLPKRPPSPKEINQPNAATTKSDTCTSAKLRTKKEGAKADIHKTQLKPQSTKLILETLRSLGFTHEEKKLRTLIKAKKGNLNDIIDELDKW